MKSFTTLIPVRAAKYLFGWRILFGANQTCAELNALGELLKSKGQRRNINSKFLRERMAALKCTFLANLFRFSQSPSTACTHPLRSNFNLCKILIAFGKYFLTSVVGWDCSVTRWWIKIARFNQRLPKK